MKIEDNKNIINFRYKRKYLRDKYPKNVSKELLLKYPNIFEYFDSIFTKKR